MNLDPVQQDSEAQTMQLSPLDKGQGPTNRPSAACQGKQPSRVQFLQKQDGRWEKRSVINPFCKSQSWKFAVCSKSVCCTAGN